MKHDELADMFNIMKYAESIGRLECIVPSSRLIKNVLEVIKKVGYIEDFKTVKGNRSDKFRISLNGKINDCNVVRPRFPVTKNEFIKWEKKFLPSYNIGTLILTTPKGIIDQKDARKLGVGGKLLGYIY